MDVATGFPDFILKIEAQDAWQTHAKTCSRHEGSSRASVTLGFAAVT